MAHAFFMIMLLLFLTSLSSSSLYIVFAIPFSSHHLSFSLTHRDAESSPLRDVEADPADLPQDMPLKAFVASGRALRARSNMQRKLMMANQPLVQSRLSNGGANAGEFFLTVPVGMPSQNLNFLVDTGSEFSWTQCSPCLNCTHTPAPHFTYNKSSSFRAIRCDSNLCRSSLGLMQILSTECDNTAAKPAPCFFGVVYGDESVDIGFISIDSFHLGPEFSKPFVFGCSNILQETLLSSSSGLLGLNAGPFSFTSQLFSGSPGMPRKFAYCLPDRLKNLNAAGRIEFGNYKQPKQMRFTAIAPPYSPLGSLYYYVELQGITVGESLIKVDMQRAERMLGGGTIFDSGSTVTHLVKPLYDKLVAEMRRQTADLHPFNATQTELGSDLCYKVAARAREVPEMPTISMHFAGGVELELGTGSILTADRVRGDNASIYFCLAFESAPDSLNINIIGNYQQQDYWVEYNLDTFSLGLAKAKCADV